MHVTVTALKAAWKAACAELARAGRTERGAPRRTGRHHAPPPAVPAPRTAESERPAPVAIGRHRVGADARSGTMSVYYLDGRGRLQEMHIPTRIWHGIPVPPS